MSSRRAPTFDVSLSNVPIFNLRAEFKTHYRLIKKGDFIPGISENDPFDRRTFNGLALMAPRSVYWLREPF